MLTKLLKKMSRQRKLICHVDAYQFSLVRGWIAHGNNKAFKGSVDLLLNGELLKTLQPNQYRSDLKNAGIAKGYAAFEFEYPEEMERTGTLEIRHNKRCLFLGELGAIDASIKNKDFSLERFFNSLIKKRKVPMLMPGVTVSFLPSSLEESKCYGDTFVRITNKSQKNRLVEIGDAIEQAVEEGDRLYIGGQSSKATYALLEIFNANSGILINKIRVDIKKGSYSTKANLPKLSGGKFLIKLKLNIEPESTVDLGSVSITKYLPSLVDLKKNITLEVDNHKVFEKHIQFDDVELLEFKPVRKQQLCQNLFYEEKPDIDNDILMQASNSSFSINARNLQGYSRIAIPLELERFKTSPLKIRFTLTHDSSAEYKGCYIYSQGLKGRTLNKIKLVKTVTQDQVVLEGELSLKHTLALGDVIENHENVQVGFEFNANNHYGFSDIYVGQEALEPLKPILGIGFEDPALVGQVEDVAAFEEVFTNISSEKPAEVKLVTTQVMNSSVDIVIPVFNAKTFVKQCVESIFNNTSVNFRIILMDDCSTDGVSDYLAELANEKSNVIHQRHPENVGYTGNVNRGLALAKSEWVVLLNSDTIVSTNWVENMLEVAKTHEKAAIIGPLGNAASWQSIPRVFNDDGAWDFNILPEGMQVNEISRSLSKLSQLQPVEVGVLNGFCQLINREAYEAVGRLDEENFPRGYGEENDLCARLVKSGYKLLVCPTAYVYHHKSKSFGHKTRTKLSSNAKDKLGELHPDYDWKLVTQRFYNNETMKQVRRFAEEIYVV